MCAGVCMCVGGTGIVYEGEGHIIVCAWESGRSLLQIVGRCVHAVMMRARSAGYVGAQQGQHANSSCQQKR